MARGSGSDGTKRVKPARKPVRVRIPVSLPADSAPERWLANIRVSGFTIMIMVLVVFGVVVLAPSLKLLIEQRSQIAALQNSVNKQKDQVTTLRTQVARWSDPAYIEAQARNRLLFAAPGEYSYLVIPDKSTTITSDGAPISKHIQTTRVDWVKSLTSSLFSAGLSTATASKLESGTGSGTIVSPTTGSSTGAGK
jgi:cell division protein FtsB